MPRRRFLVPPLAGPIPHAGGWGLPGPGIRRPVTETIHAFRGRTQVAIRGGEGTKTGIVPASGTISLSLGPDGLNVWYLAYASISTTTGTLDASTAGFALGPVGAGINPAGASYTGGGDSIGLGGERLAPGDFLTVTWFGAKTGDTATVTVHGTQDIPV